MRAVYFILPFIKSFIMNKHIYKMQEYYNKNENEKNVSILNNFDRLSPTVQQFMLSF
jgi:hypothetical protein